MDNTTSLSTSPHLSSTPIASLGGVVTCMKVTLKSVFLGLDTGKAVVQDHDGNNTKVLRPGEKAVWCLDVWEEEDGEEVVVMGGVDMVLYIYHVGTTTKTAELTADLRGHTNTVRCAQRVSPNTLISSSRDCDLRIWNLENSTCTAILSGHTQAVRKFAVHGDLIASVSYDHDARIWSISEKKCLHVLQGHEAQIYAVNFDGKRIVTGGLDHAARVWDPDTGVCIAVLKVEANMVTLLRLLPFVLVGADNSGNLHVWSSDNYDKIRTIEAHKDHSFHHVDAALWLLQHCDGRKRWESESLGLYYRPFITGTRNLRRRLAGSLLVPENLRCVLKEQ